MKQYRIMLQQRHLGAIIGALRFAQQVSCGSLLGTLGKIAMESWLELPVKGRDPYPTRAGNEDDVRSVVDASCRALVRLVWDDRPPREAFALSGKGRLAKKLLIQRRQRARRTRYQIVVSETDLIEISRAVTLELRTRMADLWLVEDVFYESLCVRLGNRDEIYRLRQSVKDVLTRMKEIAWQFEGAGNYGPWFSYKSKFLYDIYQVLQHEFGHWRFDTFRPMLSKVPIMRINQILH